MNPRKPNSFRKIDAIQAGRISKSLRDLAGDASARKVSGSGSRWYALGDIWSKLFLIEGKDKAKPSKQRTIHKEHLDKIKEEAFLEGKIPVYAFAFGDGEDYMAMVDSDWYDMVGRMLTAEKKLAEIEPEYEELKFRMEGLEK